MGTTLLIVEYLIIGFQVMVWVGLLLWTFMDSACVDLAKSHNCSPVAVTILLAAAYTLGFVFDRFIGCMSLKTWAKRSRDNPSENPNLEGRSNNLLSPRVQKPVKSAVNEQGIKEWRVMLKYSHVLPYIENQSRLKRLLRATCINSTFTMLALLVAAKHLPHWPLAAAASILFGYLAIASCCAWADLNKRLIKGWDERLAAYESLAGETLTPQARAPVASSGEPEPQHTGRAEADPNR
ncbi:MAG: hypothetical protein JW993_08460 [Sedimentisphaerales bacterium]|nr:hypothetical protein [Sedimentisphaerales bacterium]